MTEHRRLLVTGCGRSGTTYLARVFRTAGLDCPHERVGALGTVSWYFAPPRWAVRPKAAPRESKHHARDPGPEHFTFGTLAHVVRDPLKVINSACGMLTVADLEFIRAHSPFAARVTARVPILIRYWSAWQQMILERKPALTFRIEDTQKLWPQLCLVLGASERTVYPVDVSTTTNGKMSGRFAPKTYTYEDLKQRDLDGYRRLREVAAEFGYEVPR